MYRTVAEHGCELRKAGRLAVQRDADWLQHAFRPPAQSTKRLAWAKKFDNEASIGILSVSLAHRAANDFRVRHLANVDVQVTTRPRGAKPHLDKCRQLADCL